MQYLFIGAQSQPVNKKTFLKTALKILKWLIVSLVLLVLFVWVLVNHSPFVQDWLGRQAAARLSKELHTSVTVKSVRFKLFNNMEIGGLLVKDQRQDTLLHAGIMSVKITDWFFRKDHADLSYIGLEDVNIYASRKDSVWNYQFITDYFGGGKKSTSGKSGGIELNLKHILLKNTTIRQLDAWLGQDKTAYIGKLELKADEINFNKKIIHASTLEIETPKFYISNYTRNKPKPPVAYIDSITGGKPVSWNMGWDVNIASVVIRDGVFGQDKMTGRPVLDYFDGSHILFTGIQGRFDNLNWKNDTVKMNVNLAAKERSGLNVTTLKSRVVAYPNTIAMNDLLIRTPESEIGNFISFSFDDFNRDMSDFIHAIRMNAQFSNSIISSNDLALFSPPLKEWKRKIVLNGRFHGTVDNIASGNVDIQAGPSTSLTGSLVITGLPDANNTFIDLHNALLTTNYNDLAVFAPSLKTINGVRLSEMGQINYAGSFTGFPGDFVTYGTLQTSLGTVVTDLNLKLLPGTLPAYSGKVNTTGFNLARLTGKSNLGMIGFNGRIKGSGFKPEQVNAVINGTVTRFDYDGYGYSNITINGRLVGKKFNGDIVSKDPNLDATVSGLIDIGGKKPRFDLVADIGTAKFQAMKLSKEDYELRGKMKLNFTGSTPDNFEGEAKISETTIIKNGQPVYFDSLNVSSYTKDGNKETNIVNNQFEGHITGQFTYGGLANAFNYFLHQYYPNVFDPPKAFAKGQNFRFTVNTKSIQPYLSLINNGLTGFDSSSITGAINTFDNTAGFHALVAEGGLNSYRLNNVDITGNGTLERMNIDGTVGSFHVNDSLQFVNTHITIHSSRDSSQFTLRTAGDGTALNEVNANGTVITYDDGVMITFEPSDFTVNGRKWVMEKNGELILRKNVVNAKDMKFTHDNQEIAIRSEPDEVGKHYNLIANVKNLELGDFAPFVLPKNRVQGRLNGEIVVQDPVGNMIVDLNNTTINDLWFDNDSMAVLNISGRYNRQTGDITYKARSDNKKLVFNMEGIYRLKDSTGTPMYNKFYLTETDAGLAKRFISGIFNNVSGTATGEFEIFGSPKKQFFTGDVRVLDTLHMTVNFTNVEYLVPKAHLRFTADAIDFSNQFIYDTLGNQGYISRGYIYHDGFFKKMNFDIDMRSDTMTLLSTTPVNNKIFYGYARGDVRMKLKGPESDMRMDITANNPDSAAITLVTGVVGKTMGKSDFVEFKTLGREMSGGIAPPVSNLLVTIAANITPRVQMKLLFDELSGDNITARGNGNLRLGITSKGDVSINGGYTVESGKYAFSFQSWIKKTFDIERGSFINWTGDPYHATVNIDASYVARDVNLKNFASSLFDAGSSTSANTNLKVTAELRKDLAKPDIHFKIGYFGDVDSKNVLVQSVLNLLSSNEDELNRQVAFLILFDRLLPYEQSSSTAQTSNPSGVDYGINTISGLIAVEASKYFKTLLERIFGKGKGWDIGVDFRTYTPGNLTFSTDKRASSDIKISRSLLNDRLRFNFTSNLDFGLGTSTQSDQFSFAFLPNFLVEYKLNANGSVVATVFHRQTLDVLQTSSGLKRFSTGAGVATRKEGDSISDILGFGKKKKKKATTTTTP